jgi:hypothetical protein
MNSRHRWSLENRPLVRWAGRITKLLLLHLFGACIATLMASVLGASTLAGGIWGVLVWSIPRVSMLVLCFLGTTAVIESNR